jgi:RHS repeat-associated protein
MTIEWFSGNRKVKKITRTDKIIEFEYNPFGQRIIKKVNDLSLSTITTSYYAYDANGQVMGVYDVNLTSNNASLNELNIYGASRVGIIDRDITLCTAGTAAAAPVYPSASPLTHILGYKKYEITNYLGNVNAVITDRKLFVSSTYEAVVIMNSDYYPFGMQMPGRSTNGDKYRYGYNGMEKDNELKGVGNSYTTEFRQYDPRLGRWLSLDPLAEQAPGWSPYRAFFDNPILFADPDGLFETRKAARAERRAAINEGATVGYVKYDKKAGEYYFKRTDGDPKDFSFTRNIWSAKSSNGGYKGSIEFYDAADARGAVPSNSSSHVNESFEVGMYTVVPYYVNDKLDHYVTSIIVNDPEYPARETSRHDYIIAKDQLEKFIENANSFSWASVFSFGAGARLHLEQYQIDYANENYGDAILGRLKSEWCDPIKVVTGVGGGVLHFSAPRGVYRNVSRFTKKVPSNAKSSVTLSRNGFGQYKIEATSLGKVPGSKAVYTKIVDNTGKTLQMVKTTYDPSGKVVHTKDKM